MARERRCCSVQRMISRRRVFTIMVVFTVGCQNEPEQAPQGGGAGNETVVGCGDPHTPTGGGDRSGLPAPDGEPAGPFVHPQTNEAPSSSGAALNGAWRDVTTGVAYSNLSIKPQPVIGDGVLHVVRIDPSKARIRTLGVSKVGGEVRTGRQWLDEYRLAVVMNAGMFAAARAERDYSTHVGFCRYEDHVNSSTWKPYYQSVLVVGPRKKGLPQATILDASPHAGTTDYDDWDTVIQNLRLIRAPANNVWKPTEKKWSEAAVALDREGHILFVFSRSPLSMYAFSDLLLTIPLGVVRAMHVEGGPEASLSVHGNGIDLDLCGSYETGFNENDDNHAQWPLPNIVGVSLQ